MLYLQESRCHRVLRSVCSGRHFSYVASVVFNGRNPDHVRILPSGFAILPDTDSNQMNGETDGGSLLTIAFHVVDRASTLHFITFSSINTIYNVIADAAMSIKAVVISNNLGC